MKIKLLVNNPKNGFAAGCQDPNYRIAIVRQFKDPRAAEPEHGFVIVACDLNPLVRDRKDVYLSRFFKTPDDALRAWEKGFETDEADVAANMRPVRRQLLAHLNLAGFTAKC